ncbi:MAG: hypothetical protein AAB660_01775 [Patescibacteria group bacterium]
MQPNNENSVGPVIAIIIVLAMIILGGLYFWGQRNNTSIPSTETTATSGNVDEVTASIATQSTSLDSTAIEEDLNNTNVDNLDSGLQTL